MATARKAGRASRKDDIAYCKARLAFANTVLAALGKLSLTLKKAVSDLDCARSHRNPRRNRR